MNEIERRDLTQRDQDHAIRIALLEQSMKDIKSELHGINANVNKLVWVVVAAIVSSAVQFALRGNFNV
jgi:hypothetical protein